MATRERKSKLNAESPPPNSTSSDSASTPTTPTSLARKTTLGKTKRGSRVGRNSTITPVPKDKQTEEDEEEEEEEVEGDVNDETEENTTVNNTEEPAAVKPKPGRPPRGIIAVRRQIGTRTASLMKRRSLPDGRRYGRATTRRNSTGKVELIKKTFKDDTTNIKPIEKKRVGRPRKIEKTPETVPTKRKRLLTDTKDLEKKPEKFMKLEEADSVVSDSELIKLRRNSDSASKCSDMTDRDSLYDSPLFKDDKEIENNNQDQNELFKENIKEELMDDESNLSGKSKESKVNSETDNLDKIPLRRSRRPRKSTLKDRDTPTTPKSKHIDIKTEPTTPSTCLDDTSIDSLPVSSEDGGEVVIPLHVDTESKSVTPIIVETEKASSLSPELESEGVSVISVKQFRGEPAFLENNLGIEKDPKLGEIILDKVDIDEDADGEIEESEIVDEVLKEDDEITDKIVEEEIIKKVAIIDDSEKEEIFEDGIEELSKEDDDEEALIIDETVQEEDEEEPENEVEQEEEEESADKKSEGQEDNINEAEEEIEEKTVEETKNNKEVEESKNDVEETKVEQEDDDVVEIKNDAEESMKEEKKDVVEAEVEEDQNTNSSMETVQIEKIEEEIDESKTTDEKKEIIEKKEEDEEMESDNKENVEGKKSIDIENSLLDDNEIKENTDDSGNETSEAIKMKESHLKSLGLLTLKAADEAKIEKQRRKELLQTTTTSATTQNQTSASVPAQQQQQNKLTKVQQKGSNEYTGTLKTVIKLHRPNPEKRKRLPLKMTFQKGRGKQDKDSCLTSGTVEETYYTIQNEMDSVSLEVTSHGGQSRKTLNRSHDGNHVLDTMEPPAKKDGEVNLVIPEKASSFSIHPGRLCRDQCFYCGGKFGLFDTPCHVAQIKSLERQQKILDNEEKLAVDSCLCDACYRHVDRRANCPSYKKRLSATQMGQHNTVDIHDVTSDEHNNKLSESCQVTGCHKLASHSLRRKWFLKMKKPINKLIQVNFDPTNSPQIPICDTHFDVISHLMVCTLCKRKLSKNHIFYITQDLTKLEQLLLNQGIPVIFGSTPVVCKLCRYYANLLLKPPEVKTQKAQFVKNYRRRLLQFHNVEVMDDSDLETMQQDQQSANNKRGKNPPPKNGNSRTRSRKSSEGGNTTMEESFEGGHILLDNDVMVDYDVPMIDTYPMQKLQQQQQQHINKNRNTQQSLLLPKHQLQNPKRCHLQQENKNKDYSADMARALRANPNISMRELFPGEEELALHANIPFNSGGHKTPEGWTRVQTTLQYDDVTKHMWEELQKPYGNQSSFLRHLVLLEKYFRNGDLILSQNASYNAMNYSESIQNRLKAYDNIPTGGMTIMQQLSNAPITITPAITIKPKSKMPDCGTSSNAASGSASTSLLKTNNNNNSNNNSANICMKKKALQMEYNNKFNRQQFIHGGGNKETQCVLLETKQQQILAAASKLIKSDETSITPAKKMVASLPPELISINTKSSSLSSLNHQQSLAITLTPTTSTLPSLRKSPGPSNPSSSSSSSGNNNINNNSNSNNSNNNNNNKPIPANVIKLPDILSPNERKQTNGKPWRPTLIPIAVPPNNNHTCHGQLYQTADGRRLPSLVQVMSSGKPYHISIHDYNRMCILRREKLLQIQNKSQTIVSTKSTTPPTATASTTLTTSSTSSSSSSSDDSNKNVMSTIVGTNKKVQIPNKILEQNSVIPIVMNKSSNSSLSGDGGNGSSGIKGRKSAPTSLLKNCVAIAPKPPQLPISTSVVAMSVSMSQQNPSSTNSTSTSSSTVTSQNQQTKNIILWSTNENINGNNNSGGICSNSGNNRIILEAASVLSKIPKSLTVIPQQKGQSRVSSIEEQNNSA